MSATIFPITTDHDVRDDELISAVRTGRTEAFAALFERHGAAAGRYARSLVRCDADADDVVAEAFTRLLDLLLRHRGPTDEFRPYLLRTIKNLANDGYRRESRTEVSDEFEPEPAPSSLDHVVTDIEAEAALTAFASLPERWQGVLWRTEVLDLRPRQLAADMDVEAHTVSALAHRAREGLRNAYLSVSNAHTQEGCHEFTDLLGAFARQGLGRRARTRVAGHVADCSACARSLDAVREQMVELRLDRNRSASVDLAS